MSNTRARKHACGHAQHAHMHGAQGEHQRLETKLIEREAEIQALSAEGRLMSRRADEAVAAAAELERQLEACRQQLLDGRADSKSLAEQLSVAESKTAKAEAAAAAAPGLEQRLCASNVEVGELRAQALVLNQRLEEETARARRFESEALELRAAVHTATDERCAAAEQAARASERMRADLKNALLQGDEARRQSERAETEYKRTAKALQTQAYWSLVMAP